MMTNTKSPLYLDNAEKCTQAIWQSLGDDLRVATPLAAGKANHLLNALYRQAKSHPERKLTIYTALTLEKPKGGKDLERRFFGPFSERVFGNYPDLDYELDRITGHIPANIQVIEFYFPAGKYLNNELAQQNYISTNYTHVARDLLSRGLNVLIQQVAKQNTTDGLSYSLSCNADVTPDIIKQFHEQRRQGQKNIIAVQVNDELPFMYGDAVKAPSDFDMIVDNPQEYYTVFGPPKMAVGDAEYMIGLYCSTLVRDGGELQVGIGALGDALTHSLLLRHQKNEIYQKLLGELEFSKKFGNTIEHVGDTHAFQEGLFGATEMVVDGFYHLLEAGVIKRKVYDDLILQKLLSHKLITEEVNAAMLDELIRARAIHTRLQKRDVEYLKHWGIFRPNVEFESGELIFSDENGSSRIPADLENLSSRATIHAKCLGQRLKNGAMIHGGFFLGPQSYYKALKAMSEEKRALINMRSVTKINQLYGHEEIDRLHRKDARFINTCFMITLSGAAVSDGLEDGRMISGIGGQYNFVSMAHALPDARSILNLRSTRKNSHGEISSIVWNYGHMSIPRHLRDIVVTEYGIADLRGKTDSEIIAALLNITDSRFQNELLNKAKKFKKIHNKYQIPEIYRNNSAANYSTVLKKFKSSGLFTRFPFGTDFTENEIAIGAALKKLKVKTSTRMGLLKTIGAAAFAHDREGRFTDCLQRMNLNDPSTFSERLYRKLLLSEL